MKRAIISLAMIVMMVLATVFVANAASIPTNTLAGWSSQGPIILDDGIASGQAINPVYAWYVVNPEGASRFRTVITFRLDSNLSDIYVGVTSSNSANTNDFRTCGYLSSFGVTINEGPGSGIHVQDSDRSGAVIGTYTVTIESTDGNNINYKIQRGSTSWSQTYSSNGFKAIGPVLVINNRNQVTGAHVLSVDYSYTPDPTPTPTPTPDPTVTPTPDPTVTPTPDPSATPTPTPDPTATPTPDPTATPTPDPTATPVPSNNDYNTGSLRTFYTFDYTYIYPPSDTSVVYDENGQLIETITEVAGAPATYRVSGMVKDTDGSPIAGAAVVLDYLTQKTDDKGAYMFADMAFGKYDMLVSADGYASKTLAVEVNGDVTGFDVTLDKQSAAGDGTASAGNETDPVVSPTDAPSTPAQTQSPGFVAIIAVIALLGAIFYISRKK
ncbi:hypothetical protein CUJ83_13695 [Methanocella sp. CWC-04]|uniref:Carboxypeptidase regulatory-like domain-containing protein n=1 Tax=Methanooceanicella nereidis TaxID=2052831 RepID=A0AAP2W759_9EURY|nr:carboxypeptidase-like regulatory domain-containing protein [Methanocella sp. CWC-04]MCD1296052.1 hypothetical protein [Methanocella sp. CWC-04]